MINSPSPRPSPSMNDMPPTWEEVMQVLRDGTLRNYKIDIETDSTIDIDEDVQDLMQSLKGIFDTLTASEPLMQSGMLPLEATKEIVMSVVRRTKMGTMVEDAFDKLQAPAPHQDPSLQIAQMKSQGDIQKAQLQAQLDAQAKQHDIALEQQKMQLEAQYKAQESNNKIQEFHADQTFQAQQNAQTQQLEQQRELQKAQVEANSFKLEQISKNQIEMMRMEFDKWKAELEANTQIMIAQLNAKNMRDQTLLEHEFNTAENINNDVNE